MSSANIAAHKAQWLSDRKKGIGASDIAAILNISPWSSPYALWANKTGRIDENDDNEFMEAGRYLEVAIAPWFAARTGLRVGGGQEIVKHPDDEIALCTPDGYVYESTGEDADPLGLLEIKTTGVGAEWTEVPLHYQAQCQWQMYVTGLDHVWLAVLMGRRLDVHEIERDQHQIDLMVQAAHQFWDEHVLADVPPPVDSSDATLYAVKAVNAETEEGLEAKLDDVAEIVHRLKAAKELIKEAEADKKKCEAQIREAMGPAEIGTLQGQDVFTLRTEVRSTVDTKALRDAHPEIAEQFEKKTTYRILREKK